MALSVHTKYMKQHLCWQLLWTYHYNHIHNIYGNIFNLCCRSYGKCIFHHFVTSSWHIVVLTCHLGIADVSDNNIMFSANILLNELSWSISVWNGWVTKRCRSSWAPAFAQAHEDLNFRGQAFWIVLERALSNFAVCLEQICHSVKRLKAVWCIIVYITLQLVAALFVTMIPSGKALLTAKGLTLDLLVQ